MASRTFTVLVTVTNDPTPDASAIEQLITQALEEGTGGSRGVSAAFVDAFEGEWMRGHTLNPAIEKAQRAHREIAASWANV